MDFALSESLGQELRFAKRINQSGDTELKLWAKEVCIWTWINFEIWKFQKVDVTGSLDRWKQDKTIGAGFI